MVGLVVLAGVIALVVSDLPTHTTTSYRQSRLSSYIGTIEGDVAQCNGGLEDAIKAAVASLDGAPDIQPGVATTFTSTAIADCSFTNNGVVNLADMQPPHGTDSPTIEHVAPRVAKWVFPDAFSLLQRLAAVLAAPRDRTARVAFTTELGVLQRDRRGVEELVRAAERSVGVAQKPLPLTSVTALLNGDRLPPVKGSGS